MRTSRQIFRIILGLLLICSIHAKGQTLWGELRSDILSSYSLHAINSITRDVAGNIIYAAIDNGVLQWDGTGWRTVGSLNANGTIIKLASDGSGNLYATGAFTNGSGSYYVAKWNGSVWSELGTGANGLNVANPILAMTIDNQGNVYVAGEFREISGSQYVAKWNGIKWSVLGSLNANGFIYALTSDASNNVYAAGNFTDANGKNYVAKWNGSSWSELGVGASALDPNLNIHCLTTDNSGNVYAAGQFTNASGKCFVAKWNGSAWSELGTLNANNWIQWLLTDASGNVYAAGDFTAGGYNYIAKWNGSTWSSVGNLNANGEIESFLLDANGNMYAAGDFTLNNLQYVAKWNAATNTWAEAGVGGTGVLPVKGEGLTSLAVDTSGNIYCAGLGNTVYKWDIKKLVWSELGNTTSQLNANGRIETIIIDHKNNLYAAGSFTDVAYNIGKRYVAKWDGNSWSQLGIAANAINANATISCMSVDKDDSLYVGGAFTNASGKYYVAKWNGTSWRELGTGPNALNADGAIGTIAVDKLGNVYCGGNFRTDFTDYYVAKWNGTSWSKMISGGRNGRFIDPIFDLATDKNDDVYVASYYQVDGYKYIMKWNGSAWTPVGLGKNIVSQSNIATHLLAIDSNNIYIAGSLQNGIGNSVDMWDGNAWTEVGTFPHGLNANGNVAAILLDSAGNIYATGDFTGSLGYSCVAVYSLNALEIPSVRIRDRCLFDTTSKGKLLNPAPGATITIKEDGVLLTYTPADSSFVYFTNGVTPAGLHTVEVKFNKGASETQSDSSFTATASVSPVVQIAYTLNSPTQAELVAGVTNGGSAPTYQWQDSTSTHTWRDYFQATQNLFDYNFQQGSKVRCKLTGNAICSNPAVVYSNVITFDNVVTGINPPNMYHLRLLSNPVHNVLFIDSVSLSDGWQTADIFSTDGKAVKTNIPVMRTTSLHFDVSTLPPGIYSILLRRIKGAITSLRFVKL